MKHFVGIDLGTTNSAITTYDGKDTRVWKSPEQNDVTPSAIYIDKRGNKLIGKRAYDQAPLNPDNAAILFKKFMGTSTKMNFAGKSMSPEECSAEILKVLYGYLPEEIRSDADTGIVITVPAAFNQMQKDATMQAAQMAGIGKVSLMQEPVAAVMSIMKKGIGDGIFVIFDLGGGTLDVAIAQSIKGKVNLLAHNGIAVCGGSNFDTAIMDNIVVPWLIDNFSLPENFISDKRFTKLKRVAVWAAEKAKIELSSVENAVISLDESYINVSDLDGNEIYLDIPIARDTYNKLINKRIEDAIQAVRDTLQMASINPTDVEKIVFIGGPTNYKPLRDKVSFELGIDGSMEVNPMTAVSEGASIFAESIDWSTSDHSRKSSKGSLSSTGKLGVTFNYIARTTSTTAKIGVKLNNPVAGYEFQIDSLDTGWTSGRMDLENGTVTQVELTRSGDNTFKIFVFDNNGGAISLENDKVIITKTMASVEAIPASHSIGIAVKEKMSGGRDVLEYLVRAGDSLPAKGTKTFKAAEMLKAGSANALTFQIYEGEIEYPITDNRYVGAIKILGTDFDEGVIPVGADLICDFEELDSGNIIIRVSVPCIGSTFNSDRNFYSRQEGAVDYNSISTRLNSEIEALGNRISTLKERTNDDKLNEAEDKLNTASKLFSTKRGDAESILEAEEKLLEAKKLMAEARKNNLQKIRQLDLDNIEALFDESLRKYARPSEITNFENMLRTAQRSIDTNSNDFENIISTMRSMSFGILFRQDWFVVDTFRDFEKTEYAFNDKNQYHALIAKGNECIKADDIDELREVVFGLYSIRIVGVGDNMTDAINILRG